jgi:hypothetical protein
MPGRVTVECQEGNHEGCPRIAVVGPREIDEIGCSCDCHPLRYDTSGGGDNLWEPGDDGGIEEWLNNQ